MAIVNIYTKEELDRLYDGSAFTVIGAGGDLKEWFEGINKLLEEKGIGKVETMYTFNGQLMNDSYDLVGDNRYQNDLTFLSFLLDGLHIGKLAMFKLALGARWFDDIVDNNSMR